MKSEDDSAELRASKKVCLLFFLSWFMMAFMAGSAWYYFVFEFLGLPQIWALLSWVFICGITFVAGSRYMQTFRIKATDSEIIYCYGSIDLRYSWDQVSAIDSAPMFNGFNKVVGEYPALIGSDGAILIGIDPSAWGSSKDREIFVEFVEMKLADMS